MLFAEMKRRLYTKHVLFSVLGILIITIGLNFMLVNDEKELVSNLKQEISYEGDVTEKNLSLALKKVRDEKSKDRRYESQVWIIRGLVESYPGILYRENKIEDYPDEYATEFYRCWRNKFQVLIGRLPASGQQAALNKLNEVKTPFAQYPGYHLYQGVLENMKILFIIIMLLVTFFASETYSESFEDESMEIIKTTKGCKKSMMIRILPVILYGIVLTMIAAFGTVGITGSVVGFKALKSSFKMISLFSFGSFSIGQAIMVMVLAEILGILAMSTLMGYVSLKTRKTTIAMASGVSLSVFYMAGSKLMSSSTNPVKHLLNAIPMASAQISSSLAGFSLNFGIWEPYAVMTSMAAVFIAFGSFLNHAICREKI